MSGAARRDALILQAETLEVPPELEPLRAWLLTALRMARNDTDQDRLALAVRGMQAPWTRERARQALLALSLRGVPRVLAQQAQPHLTLLTLQGRTLRAREHQELRCLLAQVQDPTLPDFAASSVGTMRVRVWGDERGGWSEVSGTVIRGTAQTLGVHLPGMVGAQHFLRGSGELPGTRNPRGAYLHLLDLYRHEALVHQRAE